MKRKVLLIGWLMVVSVVSAQSWGLDDCMRYAVEHATDVKRETINARQRKQDYQHAVAAFLPTVAGGVQGQYAWGRNIDPETNTYNNVTTFNNYYQLYAELNVFDGFATINAFKQARLSRDFSATAMQKAQDNIAIDVMQKYVDAVYAEASIQIASEKLSESRRMLAKMQRLYELGEKGRPDVVQMESQVAEDEYSLTHQQNMARQSLLALKSAMNYPIGDELKLDIQSKDKEKSLASCQLTIGDKPNSENIYQSFLNISPDMKSAEYEVELARYDYKIAKGRLLPSLSLSGGITTNYYKNLSQKGSVDAFATQIKNNRGEYFGISLSIPIFNASSWKAARRAKSSWQQAQLKLDDTRRRLHDNIFQAVMDRDGYAKETVQMERKVLSDSLAHHLNARKYDEGMLSTFELHTSSQTLLQSKIKLLQMQMLLGIKQRLVEYYKCGRLNVE